MVVQTRGDEPGNPEKSWEEKYAPWLIAAGVGGGVALGAGGLHLINRFKQPVVEPPLFKPGQIIDVAHFGLE